MSELTYWSGVRNMRERPLVWLEGEVKTPPFSREARLEAGVLLRRLQMGDTLGMPDSRPMPSIAPRCHELRIDDVGTGHTWRIVYRIDNDAIVIGAVFGKKTRETPKRVIDNCRRRFRIFEQATKE